MSQKLWRPDDWNEENKPRIRALRKVVTRADCPVIPLRWAEALIEAGADAMLEANQDLFKECLRILLVHKFPAGTDVGSTINQLRSRIGEGK